SNVDNVSENEYVVDFFLKKTKNIISFTFSVYIEKYEDSIDLYYIYDHWEFNFLNEFFIYFNRNYCVYEKLLNEILERDYSRSLK
ncbi:hypothetical protein, partial [Acinetobacter sp. ABJ_C5_2]|uniref:hypothetical protein n=1 Tax=Acinetobacter sp. ABJ_C5_2 TaxID=3376992 RepID=UPI0037C832A0